MNPIYPKHSHGRLAISTAIGTKDVRIEGDEITGLWADPTELTAPRRPMLVEEFLKWDRASKSIVQFTQRYAPLLWTGCPADMPDDALPAEDQPFRFPIDAWCHMQEQFQDVWRLICSSEHRNAGFKGYFSPADSISVSAGRVVFRAQNLRLFMVMEIVTSHLERLRVCKRPGCATPYFVAHHAKEAYCSPSCAEWAQAEIKKKWWAESGKSWLANRALQAPPRKKRTQRADKFVPETFGEQGKRSSGQPPPYPQGTADVDVGGTVITRKFRTPE